MRRCAALGENGYSGRDRTAENSRSSVGHRAEERSTAQRGMGAQRYRQPRSDPRRHQEWLCHNARVALRGRRDPAEVRHRPMVLRLEILQNAVDDLYRLGWLDGANHRVDAAVLDAVADLVERGIALRLRPY
jgi:hypothetical protein